VSGFLFAPWSALGLYRAVPETLWGAVSFAGCRRVAGFCFVVREWRGSAKFIGVACILVMLCACGVAMPQGQALVNSLKQTQGAGQSVEGSQIWLLNAGDTGAVLTLYEGGPHGFVFVGEDGELLSFDGWVVRSFRKSHESPTLFVRDQGSLRTYTSSTGGHARNSVRCEDWVQDRFMVATVWRQKCDLLTSDNVITLNNAGDVVRIEQVIDHSGSRVALTRSAL